MINALKYFLAVSLAFSSGFVWAEPKVYVRSDGQFLANGNEYARGFWVPRINGAEEVFSVDPAAAEAYEMHKQRALWFAWLNWGAVGAAGIYAIAAGDNFKSGTFWTIFLIPWIGGLFAGASSNRHLLKAINIVNGVPADRAQFQLGPQNLFQVSKAELTMPVLSWDF